MSILKDITKTGIRLLLEEPFYGHIFSGMLREEENGVGSIGLKLQEGQPSLIINPKFWEGVSEPFFKYGYLKHQLLHLALKHPFLRASFQQKNIFDIAADLVVNQYILPKHLSEDAITLERNSKFKKWEKNKDVAYYYQKLLELKKKDDGEGDSFPEEGNPQLQQHHNWNSFEQMSRTEQRMVENTMDEMVVQAAERSNDKLQGVLPGGVWRIIQAKKNQKKKVVDWRRVLRLFTGTGRKTYIRNTIRRPSKRYGTTPGIQVKQKQKILVALDTSGSMTGDEVAIFFQEIQHIYRQGAVIQIVECDAKIQQVYEYNGQAPKTVKGSGGTNFTPPIQYANDEYFPDCIIYFTDGHAQAPTIQPKVQVLWVISQDGIKPQDDIWTNLPGRKVKM